MEEASDLRSSKCLPSHRFLDVGTFSAVGPMEAISEGEAKLNEGIVAEEMDESMALIGHTLYTSK